MHPFEKLMAKKKKDGKSSLSETEKQAKTSVLDNLMNEMDAHDGEKLGGMKKVTVAAPDKKGLDLGLKKASDLLGKSSEQSEEMESEEMESDEMEDEKSEEDKIAELEEKVRQLQEMLSSK